MAKMTYKEQLLHPNWQRKRLEMLEAAGWKCSACGGKDETLHVHHKQYFQGRMAWEYSATELAVLCDSCHSYEHDLEGVLKYVLASAQYPVPPSSVALGLLGGYFSAAGGLPSSVSESARVISEPLFYLGMIANLCAQQSAERMLAFVDSCELTTESHAALRAWLLARKDD